MTDPMDRFRWRPGDLIQIIEVRLRADDARLLGTVLADWLDTFEDCDEETGRIEAVRRVAAAIKEALR